MATSTSGLVFEHSARPAWAHLANFPFDSTELRTEHRKWLDKRVIRPIQRTPVTFGKGLWKIELSGMASKVGDEAYNLDLSKRRAQAVKNYILERTAGAPLSFGGESLGESMPFDEGIADNDMDRAVEVFAELQKTRIKKRRKVIMKWRDPPPRTDDFTMTVHSGKVTIKMRPPRIPGILARSPIVKAILALSPRPLFIEIQLTLDVVKVGTTDKASYRYRGEGIGTDYGREATDSVIGKGSPHRFEAPSVFFDADDFAGEAELHKLEFFNPKFRFGPETGILSRPSIKISDFVLPRVGGSVDLGIMPAFQTFGKMERILL